VNIKTERHDIIEKLMQLDDEQLLTEIHQLINYYYHDFAHQIGDEEKASILRGIRQAEAGEGTAHSDMKEKHSRWRSK
jgi:hypothetical protein